MTRAEAIRDHARIEELFRNARQSTDVMERRANEIAALRASQELPVKRGSQVPGRP